MNKFNDPFSVVFQRPNTQQAFTLLELLVVLVIFAVIAVMAYGGLNTVLTTYQQTSQHATQLARLQMAFTWLRRDIEQHIKRPIRDKYGDLKPIMQGTISQIEFTRAGWRNPAQQKRSSLQRVTYHVAENILWRSYWWMLDRAQDAEPLKAALLENVQEIQFRYLDNKLRWQTQWSTSEQLNTLTLTPNQENLPQLQAIEVTLTVAGWGSLTRLFRVNY
jgi:general secretion pathway protein J